MGYGRNSNKKKKALILIKQGDDRLIINPSDLKTLTVSKADGATTLTLQTSVFKHSLPVSDYLVNDKLRPHLRDRYNLITVNSRGVQINNHGYDKKANDVVVVEQEAPNSSSVKTYIFPKGLKAVEVDGNKILINAFRAEFVVDLGRPVNRTEMELFNAARLENPPVEIQEEV